jgi:adenylate cyclase
MVTKPPSVDLLDPYPDVIIFPAGEPLGRVMRSPREWEDATVEVPRGSSSSGWFARVATRIGRIGADPNDDEDLRQKKALLVLLAVLILPVSVVWGSCYLAFGSPVGILPFIYFAISVGSLVVFSRTRSFAPFLVAQLLDVLITTTLGQMVSGGFLPSGGVGLWGILAPLGALVFLEVRQAIWWFVGFVAAFVVLGTAGELFFPDVDVPTWFTTTMLALNVVGTGAVAFTVLASFAHQRNEALAALRVEQARSEALITNVLPSSIAQRLKDSTGSIADHVECATILFADVVDFTPLAQRLSPSEVVGTLDHLFSHFDTLVEQHGLEKIKTIGDAYMAAAGVPDPCADHASRAALLALAMRQAIATSTIADQGGLQLRIGINSGPVTAGVIGTKRFLYDLWGDAVNTASRMESNGTPGEIQITRTTYELIDDEFVCRPRGTILVKGKGEMETWYLIGPR